MNLISLNAQQILENVRDLQLKKSLNLHILDSVDSTNTYLKSLPRSQEVEVCAAEEQTHGRGRLGRVWDSPVCKNIYFSSRWQLNLPPKKLGNLSLVTAIAVTKTLQDMQIEQGIAIKWPNDIYWQGKKIAGILIELASYDASRSNVIIGIGINVNQTNFQDAPNLRSSLSSITKQEYNRNKIIGFLIGHIYACTTQLIKSGFHVFKDSWQRLDYLFAKKVDVTQFGNTTSGKCLGVNNDGQLVISLADGQQVLFNSGDATIKKMP